MRTAENIRELLIKYWGYSSFREKQEEIILSVLEDKEDTLALLPTGGGKSICFQIPALAQEGICLVISPLIALMQDQVSNLQKRGIKAIAITSALSKREIDIGLDNAAYGDFKFLYVSPERLETELFQARLKKMKVNLIAVDEAHCISQWGYDFRPAYLKIAQLRELLPEVPILALTATATPKVVDDIQEKLLFKKKNLIQKSFERDNLAYVVLYDEAQQRRMLKVIDGVRGSGIIYVNRRKKAKEVAQFLRNHNISADFYHAGLNHEQRRERQDQWIKNKTQIIVATNAFGMGIDKPNVRFVIHLDLPESLEAYFQEAGRAGRDGKKSYAVLIMSPPMAVNLKQQVEQSFPPKELIKTTYLALSNFFQIPIYGGENQSFDFDIVVFSNQYNFKVFDTYNCLHFLEKEGYLSLSENFAMPSRIHISLNKEELYKFQVANKMYDNFIKTTLRTYGGLFEDYVTIKESQLATNLKMKQSQVIDTLNRLHKLEVLSYEKQNSMPRLTFMRPRPDQNALHISKENYQERQAISIQQMKAVLNYAESKHKCRSQMLLSYFGENNHHRCGICDVCLERNKLDLSEQDFNEIEKQLKLILKDSAATVEEMVAQVKGYRTDKVIKVLDFLLDQSIVKEQNGKYYTKRKKS